MRNLRGRFLLILFALLVVVRLGGMAVRESYDGPGPLAADRAVVIPPAPVAVVAATLGRQNVIAEPLVFRAAAFLTRGQGPIRAGEFLFRAHASLREVLGVLRFAAPVEHQVTIPEGLIGAAIARILATAAAATGQVAPPAEGAVLPQTYDYLYGTSRAAILLRAETALRRATAAAWAARDPAVPLATPAQALVLASIVQQETPLPGELPMIAAVYENRLAIGMRLQADPTVIFAASNGATSGGAPISRADLGNPSTYNTYLFAGLPPGPICAPGLAAIEAVLHPAATTALYFVATGSGGHVFADNFKQQLANIQRYHESLKN